MAAPKKNKYWEFREKHGRDYKYTPEKLMEEAKMYFEWVEANPLYELKAWHNNGKIVTKKMPKMRAMTEKGFCLFADISHATWENYKNNKDFLTIITRIKDTIYSQKFEGAAADLLDGNIIARDLGLKDKSDITTGGKSLNEVNVNFTDYKQEK